MDEEVKNFIKVWISVIISVTYCYYIPSRIKPGLIRLLFVLPVSALFLVFPMFLSTVIFCSYTAFYLTLANSKLILFSFDQGPLYPLPSNLPKFICFTCFPIKLQQNPNPNPKSQNPNQNRVLKWLFPVKVAIFVLMLHLYDFIHYYLPYLALLGMYPLHVYLEHEILLTTLKFLVKIVLGYDLEPHFNEPYLATSLQDFWGRRWNLMVTDNLRLSIYNPVKRFCEQIMNTEWATIMGVMATFIVSGVAHEVLFVYLTREIPTGEVTLYFVLHGVCTVVEVLVKKKTAVGRRLVVNPLVSTVLTVGFVCVSGGWLFFPQIKQSNVMGRRANEAFLLFDFFKHMFYLS